MCTLLMARKDKPDLPKAAPPPADPKESEAEVSFGSSKEPANKQKKGLKNLQIPLVTASNKPSAGLSI